MYKNILGIILLILSLSVFGQFNTDSLENKLQSATGVEKAKIMNRLAYSFRKSGNPAKGAEWALKAADFAKSINNKAEELSAYVHAGYCYYYSNAMEKSQDAFEKAIKLYDETGIKDGYNSILTTISQVYIRNGKYEKSITNFEKLLKMLNEKTNAKEYASLLNDMGLSYLNWKKYDKAQECYERAQKIAETPGEKSVVAAALQNIGNLYGEKNNFAKALEFHKKALSAFESIGNAQDIVLELNDIGLMYQNFGNFDEAVNYFNKALQLAKNKGLNKFINPINDNISNAQKIKEKKSGAVTEYEKNIKESDKKKLDEVATLSNQLKDENLKKQLEVKQLAEENTQKEQVITQKEQESKQDKSKISTLKEEKEKTEVELIQEQEQTKQQKQLIMFFILVMVVVIIFSILLFRQFRLTKKAYSQLFIQNEEIRSQKTQLEVQSKDILMKNSELEEKNMLITDSINYAKTIQEAILPNEKYIQTHIPDFFIFYRPRDIVSGDFYWFGEINDILYIAIVDCTGHGVPGGFMSMIGNTLLNEIIFEKQIYKPSDILDKLNSKVISFLNKDSKILTHQEDGMDITVCSIHRQKKEIQIALANHTAFLISDKGTTIVAGDDFSIGDILTHRTNHKFANQIFSYSTGTSLFMFSDGFKDQFGAKDNRKFSIDRMQKLFEDNSRTNMNEISAKTEKAFIDWKGSESQIDDVLVVGIKL